MSCTKCGKKQTEYVKRYKTCFSCYRNEPYCMRCKERMETCNERFCNDCCERTHLCNKCRKDHVYCHYHDKIMKNIYCSYCEKYVYKKCCESCYSCYERYCDNCIENCRLVKTDCCRKWACDKRLCGPKCKRSLCSGKLCKDCEFCTTCKEIRCDGCLKRYIENQSVRFYTIPYHNEIEYCEHCLYKCYRLN